MNTRTLVTVLAAATLTAGTSHAQMGFPQVNRDSLNALTDADHSEMMAKLGLRELRPGKDGYSTDPKIGANYDQTIANPYMNYPDPLVCFDGKPVKNARTWFSKRRPELVEVFEEEFYGRIPENVPDVNWQVVKEEKVMIGQIPCVQRELSGVVDNSSCPEIEVVIKAEIVWPESTAGNMPVIVEFGFMMGNMTMRMPQQSGAPARKSWKEQIVERGWAACTLSPTSYQADGGHGLRQGIIGLCNKGQSRKPDDWGSLRAWGWGASKLLDYFETQQLFDASKVAVEGNSRYGKTALVATAFDERIASAFVSSSGKGGATPWRRYCGETVENIAGSGEYHWMAGNFLKYAADPLSAEDMPVDNHELLALCAPRPILISSGLPEADKWQDIIGMYLSTTLASPAYELVSGSGLVPGYGDGRPAPQHIVGFFPGVNVGLMGGRLAFRLHDGGHEPGPNWPYFLDFFDRYVVRGEK